ncbi:hypothetical protein J4212_00550 [Candidatus Woesearchaeota archaeon]|nr:hypothetical protein [Candidatus Woesearchaeota archaeon]
MSILIYYEAPLFAFVLLAAYTIYQLILARKLLKGGSLSEPYKWFILAAISIMLWSIDHIYHDLKPLSESMQLFFHYGISHGLLLISMLCLTIAAFRTKKVYASVLAVNPKPGKRG